MKQHCLLQRLMTTSPCLYTPLMHCCILFMFKSLKSNSFSTLRCYHHHCRFQHYHFTLLISVSQCEWGKVSSSLLSHFPDQRMAIKQDYMELWKLLKENCSININTKYTRFTISLNNIQTKRVSERKRDDDDDATTKSYTEKVYFEKRAEAVA